MEPNPVPPEEEEERQRRQARRALFVLSCLMVTLGMMLPRLLPSPRPTFDPRHILPRVDHAAKRNNDNNDDAQDPVTLMQEHLQRGGCMWPGSGWITGLLLTSDGRLVVSNWHAKTLTVKSPFAEVVIPLPVQPLAVTLLENWSSSSSSSSSSPRVAVTSGSNEILLVDVDQPDLPFHTIRTGERNYSHVTSGLEDGTLIVSTVATPQGQVSVDVITRHGDVIETLTDTARCPDLRFVHFLTRHQDNVFISALDRNNESTLIRLRQSVSEEPTTTTTPQRWEAENIHHHHDDQDDPLRRGHLWGTAGHARWGIFIGQDGGVVLRKKGDGKLVAVADQTDPYFNPTVLAVGEDKLFVVWDHYYVGDFVMVEYHLQSLHG